MMKQIIKVLTILALSFGVANSAQIESTLVSKKMLNRVAKQRMLSQAMAKNYFYLSKGVNKTIAKKNLKKNITHFKRTQQKLSEEIIDDNIKSLIDFVDMSLDEFTSIYKEKYSDDNGIIMLDLSESLLEGSDYVVQALVKGKKSNKIIEMAGKQRMLSQRIAKYYMVYQIGIKDDNTIIQMRESIKEFNDNLKALLKHQGNTPKINVELNKVNKMWKIVYKLYLNIETGGLPKIVYSTTDKITKKMNAIVSLYQDNLKK